MRLIRDTAFALCVVSVAGLTACDDSPDYDSKDYQAGYDEGHAHGIYDALKCVKREGGRAEDAADYCDRRL